MKVIMKLFYLYIFIAICFSKAACGNDLTQSSQNEIFENPFVVTGFNKKTNILTGYITILRTSPGRTDECKITFAGRYEKDGLFKVFVRNAVKGVLGDNIESNRLASGEIRLDSRRAYLVLDKKTAPGDCDWIADFADGERVVQKGGSIFIQIKNDIVGNWVAVSVIKSPKAYFHKNPDEASASKAYLIAGNMAYIFDEQSDWYLVKFRGRKKETVGWIRKSDMIQFPM